MMPKNRHGERPLVLIVDDDEDLRFLAGEALKKYGFSVVEAVDGIEALSLFERLKPEIVLLDVLMPKMDGFAACAALRLLPEGSATPVVMMTALEDIDSINRAYEAGATDFITKPINWIILAQRVRYMLRAGATANELRRSEARNAALLNAIPDLMFRVDKEGVFLEVKGSKEVALPMPLGKITGKRISEVMPIEAVEPALHHMKLAIESGIAQVFEYNLRFSGKLRFYEARIVTSGVDEVLCILRDITERKEMEEDLLKAKKLETVGILAGGIAHDYNNLLTVILAGINMAQARIDASSLEFQRLSEAEKATLRARDLTQQFITFSNGGIPFKKSASVATLVEDTLCLTLKNNTIACACSFPEDLWTVEIDEGQMRQAINNIVANAEEAMPGGGVLKICAENIEIKPHRPHASSPMKSGRYVKLSIKDQGAGIDRVDFEKVFDPYFSTKERGSQKGMGLGLTVAYSILKKHGGHISFESESGIGTAFHLFIPASDHLIGKNKKTVNGKFGVE